MWHPPEMQDLRRYGRGRDHYSEADRLAAYAELDYTSIERRLLEHERGPRRVLLTPLGLKVLPRRMTMALLYGASFHRAVAIALRFW